MRSVRDEYNNEWYYGCDGEEGKNFDAEQELIPLFSFACRIFSHVFFYLYRSSLSLVYFISSFFVVIFIETNKRFPDGLEYF